MNLRNRLASLGWLGCLGGLAIAGCDPEPKNLGNESDDNGGSAEGGSTEDSGTEGGSGSASGSTGDPACVDGDTKMEDCNSCECLDGFWGCTEIGCGDEDPLPGECVDGDTKMEDCNSCECLDGFWACTEIACDPGPGIAVCDDSAPRDALFIDGVVLDGDLLQVDASYGGGCETHVLDGCWDGSFAESDPVQVWAFVSHESNDDACDAVLSSTVEIDLTPMKAAYQAGYQTQTGMITIHLEGWPDAILYAF